MSKSPFSSRYQHDTGTNTHDTITPISQSSGLYGCYPLPNSYMLSSALSMDNTTPFIRSQGNRTTNNSNYTSLRPPRNIKAWACGVGTPRDELQRQPYDVSAWSGTVEGVYCGGEDRRIMKVAGFDKMVGRSEARIFTRGADPGAPRSSSSVGFRDWCKTSRRFHSGRRSSFCVMRSCSSSSNVDQQKGSLPTGHHAEYSNNTCRDKPSRPQSSTSAAATDTHHAAGSHTQEREWQQDCSRAPRDPRIVSMDTMTARPAITTTRRSVSMYNNNNSHNNNVSMEYRNKNIRGVNLSRCASRAEASYGRGSVGHGPANKIHRNGLPPCPPTVESAMVIQEASRKLGRIYPPLLQAEEMDQVSYLDKNSLGYKEATKVRARAAVRKSYQFRPFSLGPYESDPPRRLIGNVIFSRLPFDSFQKSKLYCRRSPSWRSRSLDSGRQNCDILEKELKIAKEKDHQINNENTQSPNKRNFQSVFPSDKPPKESSKAHVLADNSTSDYLLPKSRAISRYRSPVVGKRIRLAIDSSVSAPERQVVSGRVGGTIPNYEVTYKEVERRIRGIDMGRMTPHL